jgi:hypothetical protein
VTAANTAANANLVITAKKPSKKQASLTQQNTKNSPQTTKEDDDTDDDATAFCTTASSFKVMVTTLLGVFNSMASQKLTKDQNFQQCCTKYRLFLCNFAQELAFIR